MTQTDTERLDRLEPQVQGNTQYLRRIEELTLQVDQRVSSLAYEVTRVNNRIMDRVEAVEGKVDRLQTDMSTVKIRLNHMDAKLDQILERLPGSEA